MVRKLNKVSNNEEIVLESNENAIFNKETEGLSQGQIILKRFCAPQSCHGCVVFLYNIGGNCLYST